MQTITKNKKYVVSTVKSSKGLYETMVFPITNKKRVWIYTVYEHDWGEVDKINFYHWYEQLYYHNLMIKYWSTK